MGQRGRQGKKERWGLRVWTEGEIDGNREKQKKAKREKG